MGPRRTLFFLLFSSLAQPGFEVKAWAPAAAAFKSESQPSTPMTGRYSRLYEMIWHVHVGSWEMYTCTVHSMRTCLLCGTSPVPETCPADLGSCVRGRRQSMCCMCSPSPVGDQSFRRFSFPPRPALPARVASEAHSSSE